MDPFGFYMYQSDPLHRTYLLTRHTCEFTPFARNRRGSFCADYSGVFRVGVWNFYDRVPDHFSLPLRIGGSSYMKRWSYWLSVLLFVIVSSTCISHVHAQARSGQQDVSIETSVMDGPHGGQASSNWEGSVQGVAYSEFNHRFVGLFVLLFGLVELGRALRYPLPLWSRFVLPCALGIIGVFLLVWSDHEAWPIGSLSLIQTFSGRDPEILQHKFYGVFAATAAVTETFRRIGWARHPAWAAPLVFFGLTGALLLFVHSHGNHPANSMIALHHTLLGSLGVGATVSATMSAWTSGGSRHPGKNWELAWAGFVILIGIQLLLYFE
jgi:hypothetical protein